MKKKIIEEETDPLKVLLESLSMDGSAIDHAIDHRKAPDKNIFYKYDCINKMKSLFSVLFILLTLYCHGQSDSLSVGSTPVGPSFFPRVERFTKMDLVLPSTLFVGGIALNSNHHESFKNEIVEERNEYIPSFRTYVDDYLQFSPIVAAYGLDALGYPSKTDLGNRTLILIKGELGMFGLTQLMKRVIGQRRPDGSNYHSFPSGHTAQAFSAATFLSEEYQHRFKWMPYVAYGAASSVGAFRMVNNKHYISDVLVGAALGILTMKASYWTHRYLFGK